jgi:chemotaxis protein methyltransferase CheR
VAADAECVAFLQWCLPRLGLRWPGFRKVRRTVCKRVARRARSLGLDGLAAYRARLEAEPGEWALLDELCRIPISRFWRDRGVFECLRDEVLPALAATADTRPDRILRAWSAGCASGEEPYSLALAWRFGAAARLPRLGFELLATDADPVLLGRAARACYRPGSLRELPAAMRAAFSPAGPLLCLRPEYAAGIAFARQDLRREMPAGPFDLILCRNLAFTYFDAETQRRVLAGLRARLVPGGALVLGRHERLPDIGAEPPLAERRPASGIFRLGGW